MTWLLDSAVTRHDDLARLLDYLADSQRMANVLMIIGSVVTVLNGDPFLLFFFVFVWLYQHTDLKPATYVVSVWEFNVWLNIGALFGTIVRMIAGPDDLLDVLTVAVHLIVWIIIQYLVVETIQPPRKRKKITVRVPVFASQGV